MDRGPAVLSKEDITRITVGGFKSIDQEQRQILGSLSTWNNQKSIYILVLNL